MFDCTATIRLTITAASKHMAHALLARFVKRQTSYVVYAEIVDQAVNEAPAPGVPLQAEAERDA